MTAKEIQALLSGDEAHGAVRGRREGKLCLCDDARRVLTGSRSRSAPKRCRRRSPRSAAASISRKASDASGKSGLFDLALANELYATLLAPVEPLVKDKRSLLVVPSGALTALPFHLLVTEKPAAGDPGQVRRLSRCRLAAEAAGGVGAAVGREPEGAAGLCAHGPGHQADDRFWRSAVRPVAGRSGDNAREPARSRPPSRGVTSVAYTDFWRGAGVDRAQAGAGAAAIA